jgi:hypothetical protein
MHKISAGAAAGIKTGERDLDLGSARVPRHSIPATFDFTEAGRLWQPHDSGLYFTLARTGARVALLPWFEDYRPKTFRRSPWLGSFLIE